jgi:hypothetical protein
MKPAGTKVWKDWIALDSFTKAVHCRLCLKVMDPPFLPISILQFFNLVEDFSEQHEACKELSED